MRRARVGASIMRRRLLVAGGACAILGGLLWVFKGGSILATGVQPAFAFELAPLWFALAALALALVLPQEAPLRWAVLVACGLGVPLGLVSAVRGLLGRPTDPWLGLGLLGAVGGLWLAAPSARRVRALGRWSVWPLGLAIATPLLAFALPGLALAAGAGDAFLERFIEVPIVALGLGWAGLGMAMLAEAVANAGR